MGELIGVRDVDAAVQRAWTAIQVEWERRLLHREADIGASMHGKLRESLGDHPEEFVLLNMMQWGHEDGCGYEPDLGIERWPGRSDRTLWIAFEFKWVYRNPTAKSEHDVRDKLKHYHEAGAERCYFGFVSESERPSEVRGKLDEFARWAHGRDSLVFLEGFFVKQGDEQPRPARAPWIAWPAGRPPSTR